QAGDAHVYPRTPQTPETNRFFHTLGHDTKPVFLSEYGIGSLLNVIRESRRFEEANARPDLMDVALMRSMADKLVADWERFGFTGVYPFPEDMLRESQRLHARQRLLGFDLIRANPRLNGYNLTGMLDHGMTGEGVWTFTREWKPGIVDALSDGWAPLRWCLFVDPLHGYVGRKFRVEAVLANEDVLRPGSYPVTFRICGPQGVAWEKRLELHLPEPTAGQDAPLAVPALSAEVELAGPAGIYEFAADMERGGAPAGGRLKFYLSDPSALPRLPTNVTLWGIEPPVAAWLRTHGVTVRPFAQTAADRREVVMVGNPPDAERDLPHWTELARRMARGSAAIFLSPAAFAREKDGVGWLPLAVRGRCYEFNDWLYHKECVAKAHPVFAGLQAKGIMDWDYYGPVITHHLYDGQETPDDVVAAAFAPGYPCPGGYASGVLVGSYRFGAGRFTLSTLRVLENVDRHPAADRLLLNLINDAAGIAGQPLAPLPANFAETLAQIGYGG
ncbi:MAG: glycoside hydrolase family 2, partial [Anaerolineae bacterium]|nr:glycoside hydrolase family 2 [Anaerolineae bacterium]